MEIAVTLEQFVLVKYIIYVPQRDVITHPCPYLDSDLAKRFWSQGMDQFSQMCNWFSIY